MHISSQLTKEIIQELIKQTASGWLNAITFQQIKNYLKYKFSQLERERERDEKPSTYFKINLIGSLPLICSTQIYN